MNLNNKFKLLFNVIRNSKTKDYRELLSLLKFLFQGGKIFIIFSPRIGHQILNTFAFCSYITPDESSKYKLAISNPKRLSSNIFITKFWTRYLTQKGYLVFESDLSNLLAEVIIKLTKSSNEYVGHKLGGTKEFYISTKKSINYLFHNRNDAGQIANKGFNPLPKLKFEVFTPIPNFIEPLKYVCTFTRDSEYLDSFKFKQDFSYHDYRNDDYSKLIPTVEYLNYQSIPVLRMGNVKRSLGSQYFSRVHVDFKDCSKDGSDDVVLCSNCLFFIGDTAGLANVAAFFGRPVLRYNWIPIFNSQPYKTLVMPMLIKDLKTDEFLPFRKVWELKQKGLNISNGYSYKKFGLQCIRNTKEEIFDISKEMFRRVKENDFEPSHPHQKRFESMMKSIGWYIPGIIGYSFMEKYGHLFFD